MWGIYLQDSLTNKTRPTKKIRTAEYINISSLDTFAQMREGGDQPKDIN